jgi:hypothetical protein
MVMVIDNILLLFTAPLQNKKIRLYSAFPFIAHFFGLGFSIME